MLAALAAPAAAQQIHLQRKVRVAIIGVVGHTGLILGPAERLPDVEIVAVSDTDEAALNRFLKSHKKLQNARGYNDYRRMLDTEKPDLVAICNDDGARAAAVLEVVNRKINVIAEKPLAIDRADLSRIKEQVRKQGVKLGMLLDMRYESPYLALRRIAQSGALGEIAQISAQKSYKSGHREKWYTQRETYGSTILWIGIHMIDLMRFTTGREFTHVSSFMGRIGFPELGAMQNTTASAFRLDNGGAATLHMDYYRPETAATHGDDRLRLAGTEGVAEYMASTGVTLMTKRSKPVTVTDLPPAGSVFVDFLESIYLNKPPTLPLDDIYRVCEVTLAADEAAWTGRVVEIGRDVPGK